MTRPVQELLLEMRDASQDLTSELGRTPSEAELAERLGVTPEELREARLAANAHTALSLDAPVGDEADPAALGELLGEQEPGFDLATNMEAVTRHWQDLPGREQKILLLRFYGNQTQEQIAARLGVSQMHVSRLLARALGRLRSLLNGESDTAAHA